jgi:lipopolysaccharide export system permease protein
MWAYMQLARSSELVAARAAGHTYWAAARAGMLAAAVIGIFATTVYGPLASAALNAYDRLEARYLDGSGSLFSVTSEGLWLRESRADGQTVIRAAKTNAEGTELRDTTFLLFGEGDALVERIDARSALLRDGAWDLRDVVTHRIVYGRNAEPPAPDRQDAVTIPTRLTASEIQNSFAAPESISFWRLPATIKGMEKAGFSARRHLSYFHSMIALPFFLAGMTLIAAAFAIRPPRSARFGWIALVCALSGFALYFLSDVSMALGASGSAPPELGAWAPVIAAGLFGIALSLYFGEA